MTIFLLNISQKGLLFSQKSLVCVPVCKVTNVTCPIGHKHTNMS
jgi:hypothetical protein